MGLDACSDNAVVGVVNRGGTYLDGVLTFRRVGVPSRILALNITKTKYFPELKAVMLHDPKNLLDINSIEQTTKLPCVVVSNEPKRNGSNYSVFRRNGGQLWLKTHLGSPSLRKIIASTWTRGRLPEPLRIAHLLAKLAG